MSEAKNISSDIHLLYKFISSLQNIESLEQLECFVLDELAKSTKYDIIKCGFFNSDNNLKLIDKSQKERDAQVNIIEDTTSVFLKDEFTESKVKIITEHDKIKKYSQIFLFDKYAKSIGVFPFVSNNHIIGFLIIGHKDKITFTDNEILLLEAIAFSVSFSISNLLVRKELINHNEELKKAASMMRHDFANDMQSIEMTIELLLTTEISDEQSKFMRLLCNAKDSAVTRLKEFIGLKSKFEKSASLNIGIPL